MPQINEVSWMFCSSILVFAFSSLFLILSFSQLSYSSLCLMECKMFHFSIFI